MAARNVAAFGRRRAGEVSAVTSRISCAGCSRTRPAASANRSEEHTSELQSLMRISYAVFCLKKKKQQKRITYTNHNLLNDITLITIYHTDHTQVHNHLTR